MSLEGKAEEWAIKVFQAIWYYEFNKDRQTLPHLPLADREKFVRSAWEMRIKKTKPLSEGMGKKAHAGGLLAREAIREGGDERLRSTILHGYTHVVIRRSIATMLTPNSETSLSNFVVHVDTLKKDTVFVAKVFVIREGLSPPKLSFRRLLPRTD
ncbi:hypothetical protein PV11_06481 [Exophiala sideris]|uniref:Uncharacterized protein n=1 Tax=Exophiala sideris TaxID=1016849 RepID=A0A0D1WUL2_9EURO|nr:hypothetical protein PV11_06481 [Exophiala sideris]